MINTSGPYKAMAFSVALRVSRAKMRLSSMVLSLHQSKG
jgi:hypothetical protein